MNTYSLLLITFSICLIHSAVAQEPVLDEAGKAGTIKNETETRQAMLIAAMKNAEAWRDRTPRSKVDIPDHHWDRYIREVPQWYQDAKLGIYAHWGPYNLGMETANFTGMNNSWYPKYMYATGHPYHTQHVKLFGPLRQMGYKDYFARFTVPNFDPAKWADLIASAGARFAGPVAMHHDGFAMWDSQIRPWNSKTSGAKRDIAGELIAEYRKRGMKIVSSFHHAANVNGTYYGGRPNRPDDGPTDLNSDLSDPQYAKLYGKFDTQQEAEDHWLEIIREYVHRYRPDQIWFDGGMGGISEEARFQMTAMYYDFCEANGIEGIISQKHDQIPRRVSILDFERGGAPKIFPRVWQTDDSPGPWMYIDSATFKGADWVIPLLIDIVSKNGVLLLNIAPLADGSIHPDQQQTLRDMGKWLRVNGEAIYGTRPWKVHYQGDEPHFYAKGKSFSKTYAKYGPDDLRFTRSKDGHNLYIFAIGGVKEDILVKTLKSEELGNESSCQLLGSSLVYPVGRSKTGFVVIPADEMLSEDSKSLPGPLVFKISGLK